MVVRGQLGNVCVTWSQPMAGCTSVMLVIQESTNRSTVVQALRPYLIRSPTPTTPQKQSAALPRFSLQPHHQGKLKLRGNGTRSWWWVGGGSLYNREACCCQFLKKQFFILFLFFPRKQGSDFFPAQEICSATQVPFLLLFSSLGLWDVPILSLTDVHSNQAALTFLQGVFC
jgi:hypothetical protein